jgi:hypothetical protein
MSKFGARKFVQDILLEHLNDAYGKAILDCLSERHKAGYKALLDEENYGS